jgi:hypothetical protein
MRWVSDRSGVSPVVGTVFVGDSEAAGMGGDHTHGSGLGRPQIVDSKRIHLDLDLSLSGLYTA